MPVKYKDFKTKVKYSFMLSESTYNEVHEN